jgi:hypothetical protein
LTLFLVGAGFNIDATRQARPIFGNSIHVGRYEIDCSYPLVADVLRLCFELDALPTGKSVEDLFADAFQAGNCKPMEVLVERLMEADYRIAEKLGTSESSNSYREFFKKFDGAQFLTFNYDSLPEIFLSQDGQWHPEDGYGIPVSTELAVGVEPVQNTRSASRVIHLHGTACVYTIESDIVGNPFGGVAQLVPRVEPRYAFDPDSISHCFPRYRRAMSPTGRVPIEERVIAPVPDKSRGLKEAFIRQSYASALQLIHQRGCVIVIGYSFNQHDHASYAPLLDALTQTPDRMLVLVSPQARELANKVSMQYPELKVHSVEKTFGQWAADSFGVSEDDSIAT